MTAKNAVEERVKGLRLGAEDYIVKPFDLEELLARIETVLRRYHKNETIFQFDDVLVNTLSRQVTKNNEIIALSAKEYDLLVYLLQNQNIALYRETIYEQVWQEPYYANTRTIDLHIQRLKKKLQLNDRIESIPKVGYKFKGDNHETIF